MEGLGALIRRRGRWIVGGWLVLIVVSLPLAARQRDALTAGGFDTPGSQSRQVSERLGEQFPAVAPHRLTVLLAGPASASDADFAAAAARAVAAIGERRGVSVATGAPVRARTAGGVRVAQVPIAIRADLGRAIEISGELREEFAGGRVGAGDVRAHLLGRTAFGAAIQELSRSRLATAELVALPLVLLILLGVFGSLLAACLPVALAISSVVITGAAVYLLAQLTMMSIFVTSVASLVGIGVAVDYSLFMLARYREELAREATHDEARATALRTSGRTVAFSAAAVVVALASVWIVDNAAIRSMAAGAMLVVVVAGLTATTVLPVLLGRFGPRLARRRVGRDRGAALWTRWTRAVMARPWRAIAASLLVLAAMTTPLLSIELGDDNLRQLPADDDARQAAALLERAGGAGEGSPVLVIASFTGAGGADGVNRGVLALAAARLRADREVASVAAARTGVGARSVLLVATPRHDAESAPAKALVRRLRDSDGPVAGLHRSADVVVGGPSAASLDVAQLVEDSVWKIALLLVVLSYLVLILVLRSVLLPLKAIVLTLASVAAAYGALVAVFQWGWLEAVGIESFGSVQAVSLPLVLAVVFGLSMDYEVFLLSRIRERYDETGDDERAVAEGLQRSAGTITSAALIMVVVFSAFVLAGLPGVQQLGLGCAVAIALDATLIRLVLVPATMRVLGRWNWWMPRVMRRVWLLRDRPGARTAATVRP